MNRYNDNWADKISYQCLKNNKIFTVFTVDFKNRGREDIFDKSIIRLKKNFRIILPRNNVTTIYKEPRSKTVKVFKNIIDFGRYTKKFPRAKNNSILLNSLSFADKAIETIERDNFSNVHLYFKNDSFEKELNGSAIVYNQKLF